MANTDELRYIQAFSRIIGVKEDDAIEYTQKKGLNALVDNATQLLTTPAQREKHQAFLDLYRMSSGINARNPIINSPESASDFFHSVMDKIYDKGYSTKGENRGLGLYNLKSIVDKNPNMNLNTFINEGMFTQDLYIFSEEKKLKGK